eukprot:GHVU01109244.1.p1 GENE.GHVU01109244.1~~GHVU01109244.1.p1  ORF type:complete len:190 (+),score=19.11 GHVU01109244.1:461-1030(+)
MEILESGKEAGAAADVAESPSSQVRQSDSSAAGGPRVFHLSLHLHARMARVCVCVWPVRRPASYFSAADGIYLHRRHLRLRQRGRVSEWVMGGGSFGRRIDGGSGGRSDRHTHTHARTPVAAEPVQWPSTGPPPALDAHVWSNPSTSTPRETETTIETMMIMKMMVLMISLPLSLPPSLPLSLSLLWAK